jgi:hypothetical protein
LADDTLRSDELAQAQALARSKFASTEWTADVP